ncbi:hypothetical protein fHeYen801_039 [Yersinia phage fHe-Yen8-01]|nr:hypothetical protein fHeYen801_039 [Yersinia phage fHe-Yen8-01]
MGSLYSKKKLRNLLYFLRSRIKLVTLGR